MEYPTLSTLWTVAYQAPLSIGFFQARVLQWVAISFSKKKKNSLLKTKYANAWQQSMCMHMYTYVYA